MAIHLDEVNPDVTISLDYFPLSAYLIWQRLDVYAIEEYGYQRSEAQENFDISHLAGVSWAYPHSLFAVGHTIPQLLTLPEAVMNTDLRLNTEELLAVLRHLRQLQHRWMLGSVVLGGQHGGCLGIRCGIALSGFGPQDDNDIKCFPYLEVIFRATAATIINRVIAITLESVCSCSERLDTSQQKRAFRSMLCPQYQEETEVILVGHAVKSADLTSRSTVVFNPTKFKHLYLQTFKSPIFQTHDNIFKTGCMQYYAPTKPQSDAIAVCIDPDLFMSDFIRPSDAWFCMRCTDEQFLDSESREGFARFKQRRNDKVNAIKTIISDISSNGSERIYNVLDHLRNLGHYIPTEDDILEYLETEDTFERIKVLERLNKEKFEKEKWMTEHASHNGEAVTEEWHDAAES